MNIKEYEIAADQTAKYPGRLGLASGDKKGIIYTSLGLMGEAGEFADKVKKIIRDNDAVIDTENRIGLLNELGDVLWYVTQNTHESGLNVIEYISETKWLECKLTCEISAYELDYVATEIVLNSSLFASNLHSVYCGYGQTCESVAAYYLRTIINSTKYAANLLGCSLKDVAILNIDKLSDRQKRNKINGSGDNR